MSICLEDFQNSVSNLTIDETLTALIAFEENTRKDNSANNDEEKEINLQIACSELSEALKPIQDALSKEYTKNIQDHPNPEESEKGITSALYKAAAIALLQVKLTHTCATSENSADIYSYQSAQFNYSFSLSQIKWLADEASKAMHPYNFKDLPTDPNSYEVIAEDIVLPPRVN